MLLNQIRNEPYLHQIEREHTKKVELCYVIMCIYRDLLLKVETISKAT